MISQIWVNLPVKDLDKSVEFFTKLGFSFNSQYTDEKAACLIIGDNIYAMLLLENFFKTFIKKEIADSEKSSEVILALSTGKKEDVDEMVRKAIEAGGSAPNDKQDHGWMYGHGFQDLDGHLWEIFWMDQAGAPQG
jgi:predicted lactoylglutathione lyase